MKSLRQIGVLLCLCLVAAAGCTLFPLVATPDKLEKDAAAPGTPHKHFLRVSQFVFLSDLELSRTQPLFRELGNLREQVFKDLQLPASNTIIQVYLFEDRDKYESFMKKEYP